VCQNCGVAQKFASAEPVARWKWQWKLGGGFLVVNNFIGFSSINLLEGQVQFLTASKRCSRSLLTSRVLIR
jgi:hypothetical protein